MNNILTASRMNSLIHCPRAHFWCYEIGLQKDDSAGLALRFGSAWHRAMEYRWLGKTYDEALTYAIPEGIDIDEISCATIAALLAGYYDYYGPRERVGKLQPEQQFDHPIEGTKFSAQGKIDGLGLLKDKSQVLIESKTTGDSVKPDSDYWLRLRFNLQLYQYYFAAKEAGWDIQEVIYDVIRKPSIKPKDVGRGAAKHKETADEYCDRLWKDTLARPEFYFCRKEVPILESDLQQFINQRLSLTRMIEDFRGHENTALEKRVSPYRNQEAWPRNVSTNTCNFCQYKSFCLQNVIVDLDNLPQGFSVKPFNPELEITYATDTEENSSASA